VLVVIASRYNEISFADSFDNRNWNMPKSNITDMYLMNQKNKTAISLFCGAGGMDVGFTKGGFDVVWANDYDKNACATYRANFGSQVVCGDIDELIPTLSKYKGIDCVFGGPPCQGFSVAGNMDPDDHRSKLVMSFMEVVKKVEPNIFVMENVKALGALSKFKLIRENLFKRAHEMSYHVELLILNSKDFGVPQSRERMFLIGMKDKTYTGSLKDQIKAFERESPSVREIISSLGPAGGKTNSKTVNAKISMAKDPVLRKSPYAGMLFNGQGRPINPDIHSSTLHASMGGNRTPIIDENQLYHGESAWVEQYHKHLMDGGDSYPKDAVPSNLRRMTVDEAHLLQTFPKDFEFIGSQSSVFRQIGNAVPCNLAESVAKLALAIIDGTLSSKLEVDLNKNLELAI
jgi:DNA (cytosine-5)-methyltransferase 1